MNVLAVIRGIESCPEDVRTPGRKWRERRNIAILVLSEAGASTRWIADVFDLPCSRIGMILKQMRFRYGGRN